MNASFIYVSLLLLFMLPSVSAARLPAVGSDEDQWGTILNEYLNVSHTDNGTLRNDTVNTSNVIDSAIISSKIASEAIQSQHISNGSVNATHIGTGAIDIAAKIIDGIITGVKLVAKTITGDLIADDAINSTHIASGSIASIDIANSAINSTHIAAEAITSDKIQTSSVNSTHILDGSITSADLASGLINSTHIADGSVTGLDVSASANLSVSGVNSTVITATTMIVGVISADSLTVNSTIDLGIESQSADCQDILGGCTTTAICSGDKKVLFGFTGNDTRLCDESPLVCTGYCEVGLSNCSSTSPPLTGLASVYIVCGRVN